MSLTRFPHRRLAKTPSFRGGRRFGSILLDLVVAVAVSGVLLLCLSNGISELMRLSVSAQSRFMAANVAKSIVERIRATPFENLPLDDVTYQMRMTSAQSVSSPEWLVSRVLQIDNLNFLWTGLSSSSTTGAEFLGNAEVRFSPYLSDSKLVEVTITWRESSSADSIRNYKVFAVVSRYGIHRS